MRSPLVVGYIFSSWFEVLPLLEIQVLQEHWVWRLTEFAQNHIPCVVKLFKVVALENRFLEVVHIIQHLGVVSRRVVPEDNRKSHSSSCDHIVVKCGRRGLRNLPADFAVGDLRQGCG